MNTMNDIRRFLTNLPRPTARWSRLLGVTILTGILSGLTARGFEWCVHHGSGWLIERIANPAEINAGVVLNFSYELLLLPAIGCLLGGLLVQWLNPRGGHGTDVYIRAFHHDGGALGLKGPAVNGAGAIGVISSGGSAGPEGPIAALGAAIGSTLAQVLSMTPRERRIILVAGCGAGIGAIFQCPLGGALFATSVLYREPDFETDAIVGAFVSSVIGYSTYMLFPGYGTHMLAGAAELSFTHPYELAAYALLGPLCGAYCILLHWCLHKVEWACGRTPLPRAALATIGGLLTGLIACAMPQVLSSSYGFIQHAMDGTLPGGPDALEWWRWSIFFGGVAVAKCVATALTVGSGAPGGVLGPSVFIGGVAGAFLGAVLDGVIPGGVSNELRIALIPVGMGGVLAASMRTPLAAIVMITEMTGSYGLIVPLMLVCVGAFMVGRRWGLSNEQVRSAADSPAHAGDHIVHILEATPVGTIMQKKWDEVVTPGTSLSEMIAMVSPGTRPVFAVVDNGHIQGLISLPDVERVMDEPGLPDVIIAADMMTTNLSCLYPDEDSYQALNRMAAGNHLVMPVVSRRDTRRWIGMLTRTDVYEAVNTYLDRMREHLLTEHHGLSAIHQEDRLHQLVLGVPTPQKEIVQRLFVPLEAIGKSLRESDFRRQFGIQVVAVEASDGTLACPPDPDAILTSGHRLVAIVWNAQRPPASPAT